MIHGHLSYTRISTTLTDVTTRGENLAFGWTGGIGPLTSSSTAGLLVRRREHVTRTFGSRDLGQGGEQLRPDDRLGQARFMPAAR